VGTGSAGLEMGSNGSAGGAGFGFTREGAGATFGLLGDGGWGVDARGFVGDNVGVNAVFSFCFGGEAGGWGVEGRGFVGDVVFGTDFCEGTNSGIGLTLEGVCIGTGTGSGGGGCGCCVGIRLGFGASGGDGD